MTGLDYRALVDGICGGMDTADPSSERYERCDLALEGTLFTLIPSRDGNGDIDGLAYFAEIGPLPERQRDVAAIRLLETNLYMVGQDSPCFCWNPETEQIVLAGRMPLDRVTVDAALQILHGVAHFAFDWRMSHLAEPHAPVSTIPPRHRPHRP